MATEQPAYHYDVRTRWIDRLRVKLAELFAGHLADVVVYSQIFSEDAKKYTVPPPQETPPMTGGNYVWTIEGGLQFVPATTGTGTITRGWHL